MVLGVMDVKINEMIPEVLNKLAGAKLEQNNDSKRYVNRRMLPQQGRKNWECTKKISAFNFPQNSDIPEEVLREQKRLGERQVSILEKQASRGAKPSSQDSLAQKKYGERRRQSEDPATIYNRAKEQIMDSYDHGMFSPSGLTADQMRQIADGRSRYNYNVRKRTLPNEQHFSLSMTKHLKGREFMNSMR